MRKSTAVTLTVALLLAVLIGAALLLRPDPAHTLSQPVADPAVAALAPSPIAPAAWSPEEIFRRAFWRQPTARDRILHAERRVTASTDGQQVEGWQWFIQLQPDPALLEALRNPESFGLFVVAPGVAPRPWPATSTPAPAWFPPAAAFTEFEILQAPSTGLTVLYRASDHTLFATDSGSGFAAPVR
jgi:hypothetical protein